MAFEDFLVNNQAALIFYSVLILFIISMRKHIDWQFFGVGLYRTKVGLKLMNLWGKKYRGLVQILGYIGVGVGFIGMVFIVFTLIHGFWNLLINPEAPPVVSPVIPGFTIPGFDLKVPLITGWLALFVVIVIHEFSHGVVSKAHDIKVKSSGLLVFGPIGGAFVEPDEKKLKKQSDVVQYSMFAAGPWSNVLSALIFVLLLVYAVTPTVMAMTQPSGVEIATLVDGYPAANASLEEGMIITGVNDVSIRTYKELSTQLDKVNAGDLVTIDTDHGPFAFVTAQNPDDLHSTKGYLGVNLRAKREPKLAVPWYKGILGFFVWMQEFLNWVIILSLGIGLANLLPLGPLDGGRMLQVAARQVRGNKKLGDWWWKKISIATLFLLLVLLLIPIGKALFTG